MIRMKVSPLKVTQKGRAILVSFFPYITRWKRLTFGVIQGVHQLADLGWVDFDLGSSGVRLSALF